MDVEESTVRLTDVNPEGLLQASPSSTCSPATASFRDHHSVRASCSDPDLPSEPKASAVHPLAPSPAGDQTTACLLRGPGVSGREASYTQVSEVRSNGKLLLSLELERSSKEEGEDPQAFVVNPPQSSHTAAPKGHTLPTRDASDVTHPSSSHEPEPASPAPAYTLVDGVSGQDSLVLTPKAAPGLQLVVPKILPTPTAYLTPDLLGSITP